MARNLFNTWYNSLLSVLCVVGLGGLGRGILVWMVSTAEWGVIPANLSLFLVGRYPPEQLWRIGILGMGVLAFMGLSWGDRLPRRFRPTPWLIPTLWLLAVPVGFWLLVGGVGLMPVPTARWGGLLLTLLTAVASIFLSFPLGVGLALGRQGSWPVIRTVCIFYIELVRGFPLIGILFMAQNMLPLFLPTGLRIDDLVRAIAGLTLFSAAYLAENVRGGLQSIPRGQVEAARALGLNELLIIGLIILPQALRAVIPAIVGQFIGLFKDTSLLSTIGLLELVGMTRSVLANPEFLGDYAEVYLFVGFVYWLFCFSMSLVSRRLESPLGVSSSH